MRDEQTPIKPLMYRNAPDVAHDSTGYFTASVSPLPPPSSRTHRKLKKKENRQRRQGHRTSFREHRGVTPPPEDTYSSSPALESRRVASRHVASSNVPKAGCVLLDGRALLLSTHLLLACLSVSVRPTIPTPHHASKDVSSSFLFSPLLLLVRRARSLLPFPSFLRRSNEIDRERPQAVRARGATTENENWGNFT